jgi:hypothetical protein
MKDKLFTDEKMLMFLMTVNNLYITEILTSKQDADQKQSLILFHL